MDDRQIAKLLEKYLDGSSSDEEKQLVDGWYLRQEGRDDAFEALPEHKRQQLKDEVLSKVLQQISGEEVRVPRRLLSGIWFKVAASILLLLSLNIGYNLYFKTNEPLQLEQQTTIANQSKKMIRQLLPDGSMVWLNPNANISFPKHFSGKTREIKINGEVFFEVTKDREKPFIVHSARLVTKVWGTSFRVSDEADKSIATVTVATGKVSVSSRTAKSGGTTPVQEVMLLPRDQATLSSGGHLLAKKSNADVAELKKYERLTLKFENTTLQNIIVMLNQNFSVKMEVTDKTLGSRVMDADLTELNLPEVLEVLKASMNLDYELNGDAILLKAAK